MKKIASHFILVQGDSFANCKKQVYDYFDRTQLVRYDHIKIDDEKCMSGIAPYFLSCVEKKQTENRKIIETLISDLEATGVTTTTGLLNLEHGYPSKILHLISHFLDGFIGIDSAFYNLIDDSHWVSTVTQNRIMESPKMFWLFCLSGYSETPEKVSLVHQEMK